MHTAIFLVSNLHCPSCISYAQALLHHFAGINSPAKVSLIEQNIRVQYDESLTNSKAICDALVNGAFDINHVTELDAHHIPINSYDIVTPSAAFASWFPSRFWARSQQRHIDNCLACQREESSESSMWKLWRHSMQFRNSMPQTFLRSSWTPLGPFNTQSTLRVETPAVITVDAPEIKGSESDYVATISIGGMTCSACVSAITRELQTLDYVISADVNLVLNSARVVYHGPEENVSIITEAIEDIGYAATLDNVTEQCVTTPSTFRARLSIKGMTCGSCVGLITRALEEIPHVTSANVDLVSNSGTVEFRGKDNIQVIQEKIDDLGYEAEVVEVTSVDSPAAKQTERTVQIRVDGMYCKHCPGRAVTALRKFHSSALESTFDPRLQILQEPTLHDPIFKIVYTPSIENNVTGRHLVSAINSADKAFRATIHHPPSMEERTRHMQRRERGMILLRLVFTGIVAIPTFIIGVVYMSLVPASNHTKLWLEQAIWSGMAMRMDWALLITATPVMFFGTDLFHRRAVREIWFIWRPKSKVPVLRRFYRFGSMNLLISAGTMVAYSSSLAILVLDGTTKVHANHKKTRSSETYFDVVVFLTFFILIGKYLEAHSKAKTGDAVAMLSNLRPTEAKLLENGSVTSIPVDQLEVGDIVQLPHGQSPPTDGVVDQDGHFLFDESSLTGESRPVEKGLGDQVFTGSVNVSDVVRIKVTEIGGASMLDHIIDVVRQGQAKRAPIERLADVITGYFVPVITLVAITTWLIWLGLGVGGKLPSSWLDVQKGGWPFWSLEFAIAVFVVACPCGIGLAAPTALFVGGGLAAKNGILVQGGGEAFQEASRLDVIVFDKTGTLTQGEMKVTEFESISTNWTSDVILAMTKAMEDSSNHPIAKAVASFCAESTTTLESENMQEIPGMGIVGTFTVNQNRVQAAIGNERLLTFLNKESESEKSSIPTEKAKNYFLSSLLQKHQSVGHSTAILSIKELSSADSLAEDFHFKPIGLFSIADPIRPEAPSALESLRSRGLDIHMCTGDNPTTAHAIASQLGIPISNVRAGVLPQDKAAYVTELQHSTSQDPRSHGKRRVVAFVGDGTNDTPALSAADVSIALASGSDVAMTTASFILLNSSLDTILTLVALSKRVFRRVKMNFAWAAIYNICLVPVAAGVFYKVGANQQHPGFRLGPVWASVAMATSSVSVVLSSLALRLPEMKVWVS